MSINECNHMFIITGKAFLIRGCADDLPSDLIWGPYIQFSRLENLRDWEKDQRRWNPEYSAFQNSYWAESDGIIIDYDKRILAVHEGIAECRRRIVLQLLSIAWPGWHVRWLTEGSAPFRKALCPTETVFNLEGLITSAQTELERLKIFLRRKKPYMHFLRLLTIRDEQDRLFDTFLSYPPEHLLILGSDALDILRQLPAFPLSEWTSDMVEHNGGYATFVDLKNRCIATYPTECYSDANSSPFMEALQKKWPDWTLKIHSGGWVEHLERTGRKPPEALYGNPIRIASELLFNSLYATHYYEKINASGYLPEMFDQECNSRGNPNYNPEELPEFLPIGPTPPLQSYWEYLVRIYCIWLERNRRGDYLNTSIPHAQ